MIISFVMYAISIILVVGFFIGFWYSVFGQKMFPSKNIRVPNFYSRNEREVVEMCGELGFKLILVEKPTKLVERDLVFSQFPDVGEVATLGDAIYVSINRG